MRRGTVLLLGAVLVVGGCGARPDTMPPPARAAVVAGDHAANFTFHTTAGRRVNSGSLHGKPFILFFFASWCEYCVKQAPDIEKLHRKCQAEGIPLFAIGINGYQDVLAAKAKRFGITAPVALSQEMAENYGASTVPFTVFVGKRGMVVWTVKGAGPYEELERGLEILQKQTTATGRATRGGR